MQDHRQASDRLLYKNNGDGTFTEEAAKHGVALMVPRASRGVAFGDLFNDGNVDIVVNNLDDKHRTPQ